jgi:hypothetical protein
MTVHMYGVPKDGSEPFLMCILTGWITADQIWKSTRHLYTQELSHYELREP